MPVGWGLRDIGIAAAWYTLAVLVLTYPLSVNPASLGPFADDRFDSYYAHQNAGVLSWVVHQAVRDPLHLFEAPFGHPLPHTLAYVEHHFLPGIIALPILAVTDDLVLTYNLVWFVSLIATAMGVYLLAVCLTGHRYAAILSGLFFSFAPYRIVNGAFLQIQFFAFLPLGLACLLQFRRTGNRCWAWGVAGCFAAQSLTGAHLAVIATIGFAVGLLTLWPASKRSWRSLALLLILLLVVTALTYPLAFPLLWMDQPETPRWTYDSLDATSASLSDYLTPSSHFYRRLGFETEPFQEGLFPGLTLFALGSLGMLTVVWVSGTIHRPKAVSLCFAVILVIGWILSLPSHDIPPRLASLLWNLKFHIGSPSRFSLLPLLSFSVFASFGLRWMFPHSVNRARQRGIFIGIGIAFAIESAAMPSVPKAFRDLHTEVNAWLRKEAGAGAVVELPYWHVDVSPYMYWDRERNFRRTLNLPDGGAWSHFYIRTLLEERFPDYDSISLLRRLRVRYVVIHLDYYGESRAKLVKDLERERHDLLPVRDFGDQLVYEVLSKRDGAPEISPKFTVAEARVDPTTIVRERDLGIEEATVEIRVGMGYRTSGLRIHLGPLAGMIGYVEVRALQGSDHWNLVYETPEHWPAVTEHILGLIANPQDETLSFAFDPINTHSIRVRLQCRKQFSWDSPGFDVPLIEVLGSKYPY